MSDNAVPSFKFNSVGIDPGKTGAIAIIKFENVHILGSGPTTNLYFQHKDYDDPVGMLEAALFFCPLNTLSESTFVTIERAQAFPRMGSVSAFNYGVGYGMYLAAIQASKRPYQEISPAVWHKALSDNSRRKVDPKEWARKTLSRLMPTLPAFKKSQDGVVDAYLLAYYGAMVWTRRLP